MTQNSPRPPEEDQPIRHHVFDGIAEYDRRLPNWWLMTFYGAIVFAIGYWLVYQHIGRSSDAKDLQAELTRIESVKLASGAGAADDATLWKMSRNPLIVESGRATFNSTCASCHNEKLTGGIGPNLVDDVWLHGGEPKDLINTVSNGVLVKGMPAWGPVLGGKKVSEVVAYVLSYHQAPAGQ